MDGTEELRKMIDEDISTLEDLFSKEFDKKNSECAMQRLYKGLTAKYHSCIPDFGEGLYCYYKDTGFYDEVSGEALIHSLHQVYNKLKLFRATGYSSAPVRKTSASSGLNIYTHNYVTVNVNFAQIR